MIKHIVMWTMKDEALGATAAENAAKIKDMVGALMGKIPQLKGLEISYDIVAAQPPCQLVLYSEFEDMQGLNEYQVHPLHQACVEFIKQVVAERRVVDYTV